MLFNPANEENTFGALAGIVAATAALAVVRRQSVFIVAVLVALCFALGSDGYGTLVFHATSLWFKPLACIVFLALLLPMLCRREARGSGSISSSAASGSSHAAGSSSGVLTVA